MLFGSGGGSANAAPVPVGGGKNAIAQHMPSVHTSMKNTVTSGDPLSRSMGHYGKQSSPLKMIRGGSGQMRKIRGGLGPTKMGGPGGATDYSMKSGDIE
jgi:hypothetical protein